MKIALNRAIAGNAPIWREKAAHLAVSALQPHNRRAVGEQFAAAMMEREEAQGVAEGKHI
jgi:hypothetical protein